VVLAGLSPLDMICAREGPFTDALYAIWSLRWKYRYWIAEGAMAIKNKIVVITSAIGKLPRASWNAMNRRIDAPMIRTDTCANNAVRHLNALK